MPFSDSMFLFEIVVEELKSFVDCKEFCIKSQFADVFTLNLKDPNELDTLLPKTMVKKSKKKTKIRKKASQKVATDGQVQTGQSILFTSRLDSLIYKMKNFPIELSLYNKDYLDEKVGSTHIPWSPVYIDYLYKLFINPDASPVHISSGYNIYDDYTSKRMATIRLNIKLSHLKDKLTTTFRSLSEDKQNTFIYTGFNSKPSTVLSTIRESPVNLMQETGIIKTIYSGGKRRVRAKSKTNKNKIQEFEANKKGIEMKEKQMDEDKEKQIQIERHLGGQQPTEEQLEKVKRRYKDKCLVKSSRPSISKSDTDLEKNKQINVIKTKSCSFINRKPYNMLNYIFGDSSRPLGNQVYCVSYFTVENDFNDNESSSKTSIKLQSSEKSGTSNSRYRLKICENDCSNKKGVDSHAGSLCSLDLPKEAADLITVTKCDDLRCSYKKFRELPPPVDQSIRIDVTGSKKDCCDPSEDIEEVMGGMKAQMKFNEDACFCSCECTFGFVKKTRYCGVCGGYEFAGDDLSKKFPNAPFPCPIYHKLVDKNKLKTWSMSGSDTKKRGDDGKSKKSGDKSTEFEKDPKKGKKKRKDDRFKFNYGYAAAQIGHSNCVMPCTGTLGPVPKNMGWLWTAEDVPGLKFRPMWKPGASNKHVVRLLRIAKNPGEVTKKKRKDTGKKRPLKRPLLVVHKKDGEYTVTMETMKSYPKQRSLNQQPYEDKPVVTYTIGRTDEENRERLRKKQRAQRRLERDQREFIQSAFRDMCKEICLKTYQQALGILPDAEDPDCACYPKYPGPEDTNIDISCSCSEDKDLSMGSDTDLDEWIVEFTPPNASFDPKYKGKKVVKNDNSTQYTYLDYRVKLLDRYGNPVPRFFKGPDGKQQCSDLGGFWSPDHKWLEINIDGYIGPDERWAPMVFVGPNGEQVDCDSGKFQAANGNWLVVGVDGYVDPTGKWKFYPKPRAIATPPRKGPTTGAKKGAGDKKDVKPSYKPSEATWSCFGDANPKDLSKMGILGHGHDKKLLLATLKDMMNHGEDVKIPQPATVPRFVTAKKGKDICGPAYKPYDSRTFFIERQKCKHPVPSDKGIVAVDERGNKTYFRLRDYKSQRPKDRLIQLTDQGISLSSFHVPCFHSFISKEMMKKQQLERLVLLAEQAAETKNMSTQV